MPKKKHAVQIPVAKKPSRNRSNTTTTTRATSAIFVYHDGDHGDIELFTKFEDAIKHLEEQWGSPDFEIEHDENGEAYEWHDLNSDYCTIYKKVVK